ncbi:nuclear transport factor 2 family protein [Roseivirga sp. E12]|uniref:nuclear transport factor 2 family protein n=1 Tax=Roseivirga sp. E12 TaxID=2819237 RepID=UPI001ABC535F|nr:nuclear transport factor 2 family protein [Roseivirga sp. E12]MBO3700302.1 nuclear transport factor 2 family protein [Roseivirga sp. E12]
MKYLFFAAALLLCTPVFSQDDSIQESIDKDVWLNFMQAYQDLDATLFNQIHTNDVIRVSSNNGLMFIGQEYKDRNLENFNRWNSQKVKQRIEFSFLNRAAKGNWAYEIGIYKLTRYNAGNSQSYYGKFNVTLKKEGSTWKIFIDSDTDENGTIGEADFQKGKILNH